MPTSWANPATTATRTAAHSEKRNALAVAVAVASASVDSTMIWGERPRTHDATTAPIRPPAPAPPARIAITTCSGMPLPRRCPSCTRKSRKNSRNPDSSRIAAFARMASATTGPTFSRVRQRGLASPAPSSSSKSRSGASTWRGSRTATTPAVKKITMVPRSTQSAPTHAVSPTATGAASAADTSANRATLAFAVTSVMSAGRTLGIVAARETL